MKVLLSADGDTVLAEILRALQRFVDLSGRSEILALHVVPSHRRSLGLGGPAGDRAAQELLQDLGEGLARLLGSSAKLSRVLSAGDPAQEILRLSERFQADLMVIGARGRRGFRMGSVCRRVVSMAPADVLVVRERNEALQPEPRPGFRALIAVDGSCSSNAGIESFATKLRARDASIRVLHAVEALPALREVARETDELPQAPEVRAAEALARARRRLESRGLDAEYGFRRGSPASCILEAAREGGSEVIVLGSRGHSPFRDLVLRSTTYRVLRHAPCSVLCARGLAAEGSTVRAWASEAWEPELGMA